MPPIRLRTTASIRNWIRMSLPWAPDRHPDADLAGPLGDRDEHDVHDPDPADDQRDAGDRAEEECHRPGVAVRRVGDLLLVADREVVVPALVRWCRSRSRLAMSCSTAAIRSASSAWTLMCGGRSGG